MAEQKVLNTVKMADGRLVDFVGKRKMLKESFVDETGKVTVRFDFVNGETKQIVLRNDMLTRYAGHGAEQKIGDETAGVEDVEDMVLCVEEIIERLNSGEWGARREAGKGFGGTSILLRAIVEVTGKPVEKIKEYLKGKTHQDKMALRASAKYRPTIERLEAEKAKGSKVDLAPLEAEIDAI